MMYLVTYMLNPSREAPPGLTQQLQNTREWWHYLDNTWLLSTDETVTDLWARLVGTIRYDDRLLIVQIPGQAPIQGWLAKDAWDWINARRWL